MTAPILSCFRCGTMVPEGSRFCQNCGAQVSDPNAATVAYTAPSENALLASLRRDLAGQYDVDAELGRGGMAVVYRAVETDLRRTVALKVLPPELAHSPSTAERFKREARTAAGLDHPNIIPIFRVGQAAGTHFFAMKFIEGKGMDDVVERQGALAIPVVVHVMRAAASALAYAHERGVVHRDIKGANILADRDGRVVVSDFGIARAAAEGTMTSSGAVMGTPQFMSPEQCAGDRVGPPSDQYSLGIFAFQMLTGEVPFTGDTLLAVIHHHLETPPPDITLVREDVPASLRAIVERLLTKEPEGRYADTADLVAALEAIPADVADPRAGQALLKDLVRGASVPRVRTASMPPLVTSRSIRPRSRVPASVPPGSPPTDPNAATVRVSSPTIGRTGGAATAGAAPVAPAAARRPWMLAAAAGVLLVGAPSLWYATKDGPPAPPASEPVRSGTSAGDSSVQTGAAAPLRTEPEELPSPIPALPSRGGDTAAPAVGWVALRGLPAGARATIAGKRVGAVAELAPGKYPLSISATGYTPFVQTITITPGDTLPLSPRLDPVAYAANGKSAGGQGAAPVPAAPTMPAATGKIRLRTSPADARILVDGRVLGQGVVVDSVLTAGSHQLRIASSGYVTKDTTIVVRAGETLSLGMLALKPEGTP